MITILHRGRTALLALACLLALSFGFAQQPDATVGTDITKVLPDVLTLIGTQQTDGKLLVSPGAKIAFMGDSITQFGGYVRLAQFVLNANYPDLKPVFINVGISGQKAENMEPRFERDMRLAEKPAVAFISVGINDVWHRMKAPHDPAVLAAYKDNVAKMVDKAQAAGARVVLLTPTVINERANNEENTRLIMYVDAEKQIAADKKCDLVDLHDMFLKAIAAKPAKLNLTADGVHMNPYGDAIMAIGVLRALGMSDAMIASTNIQSAFQIRTFGMSLDKTAELLEIPASRFFKPEFSRFIMF